MALTKVSRGLLGGSDTKNLIINGAMQVAQRGTTSTSANYQTVDRFRNGFGGVSLTQSQETVATGDAPFQAGFRKFLRLTQTAAGNAATDYAQISQRIEGLTAGASGWDCTSSDSYITVSAWVRSSLAGTYYLYLQTRSSTSGYINMPFTVSANVWTKVEFVISGNSGCFIDYDNTAGIECRFIPYYGTNYTTSSVSSNSWYFDVTGGELPDFSQNWCGTSSATFDITGLQLEVGNVATPFEHRSYGEELALCQRYFWSQVPLGSATGSGAGQHDIGIGQMLASFQIETVVTFPVTMRAAPTLDVASGTDYFAGESAGNNLDKFNTLQSYALRPQSALIYRANSSELSGTAGQAVRVEAINSNAYLYWDAEL